ncbi:Pentatricopeptide repeat-containing protein [Platanthera guangdongensis]|uniref:Pentatricopeptide repeat-containing protein n=1 Tax=Platanthera guangdongensis TaxID=2320717 RepID=A0ABR2MX00_9ASPA
MLLPHLRLKSSFRPLRPTAVLPHRRHLLSPSPAASRIHLRQPNSISSPSINASPPLLLSEETCLRLISCSKSASPKQSSRVHSPILKLGLAGDLLLCNNLLSLYSKHGQPGSARKVFDEMPVRDIVSWTAIVSAFVQSGDEDEALRLYQRMLLAGFVPNHFTLSSVVRLAASLRDFDLGTNLHGFIIKRGFGSNFVLESGLVDFYSKCGLFDDACRLELMAGRDVVSWTTMISASVQAEDWRKTVSFYMAMLNDGVFPNEFTLTMLLSACSNLGSGHGDLVHGHLILLGIELNLAVKTALVDMYSKCGNLGSAVTALRLTSDSDVILCTAIISGFARAGDCTGAVSYFKVMLTGSAIHPNSFTYATLVNASSNGGSPELGKMFHCLTVKAGVEDDASVGNAIVDFYSKWSSQLEDPVRAFEEISSPNVVSWTALIAGLVSHGDDRSAMTALTEMQAAGVKPSSFTLSAILTNLSSQETVGYTQKLHAAMMKANLNTRDITVGNSLVDAYAKLVRPRDALNVFDDMSQRDFYTYTSLIKCLNLAGLNQEALSLIVPLRIELGSVDGFTLASFLSAAAGLAATKCGGQLHGHSVVSGLDAFSSVSNSLVDMYGKCGRIDDARVVFVSIQRPNVVSWNSLMSGMASNGCFSDALSTFEDMRIAGVLPDSVTFLIALYACSHGGLIDLGIDYFHSMEERFGLVPTEDHYVCLVDMLGRAGRLEAAAAAVESMGHSPGALVYKTLLGCCRLHGNLVMGEWAASRAMEIHPLDSAVYVLLAGMYDDAGRIELGDQIRRTMKARGATRSPGTSWIQPTSKESSGQASNDSPAPLEEIVLTLASTMEE